jgi:hypothetical protein
MVLLAPLPRRHRRHILPEPNPPGFCIELGVLVVALVCQRLLAPGFLVPPGQAGFELRQAGIERLRAGCTRWRLQRELADDAAVAIVLAPFDLDLLAQHQIRQTLLRFLAIGLPGFRSVDRGEADLVWNTSAIHHSESGTVADAADTPCQRVG